MAAGLAENALSRIDQNQGEVGDRRAFDHVWRISRMARHIERNEFTLVGFEMAIGAAAGEPAFSFGLRAVHRRGWVRRAAPVVRDAFRIAGQPAEQRGFSVIRRAADDESQVRPCAAGGEKDIDIERSRVSAPAHRHRNCPSFLLCSMESVRPLSMGRSSQTDPRPRFGSATISRIAAAHADNFPPIPGNRVEFTTGFSPDSKDKLSSSTMIGMQSAPNLHPVLAACSAGTCSLAASRRLSGDRKRLCMPCDHQS